MQVLIRAIALVTLLGLSTFATGAPQETLLTGDGNHGPYRAAYRGDVIVTVQGTYDGTVVLQTRPLLNNGEVQLDDDDWVTVYTYANDEDVAKQITVGDGQFRVNRSSSTSGTAQVQSWDVGNAENYDPSEDP